jgi:hypothetical protein
MWDPAAPGSHPARLDRHHDIMMAVAVLPGGQVTTGGTGGAGADMGSSPPAANQPSSAATAAGLRAIASPHGHIAAE